MIWGLRKFSGLSFPEGATTGQPAWRWQERNLTKRHHLRYPRLPDREGWIGRVGKHPPFPGFGASGVRRRLVPMLPEAANIPMLGGSQIKQKAIYQSIVDRIHAAQHKAKPMVRLRAGWSGLMFAQAHRIVPDLPSKIRGDHRDLRHAPDQFYQHKVAPASVLMRLQSQRTTRTVAKKEVPRGNVDIAGPDVTRAGASVSADSAQMALARTQKTGIQDSENPSGFFDKAQNVILLLGVAVIGFMIVKGK